MLHPRRARGTHLQPRSLGLIRSHFPHVVPSVELFSSNWAAAVWLGCYQKRIRLPAMPAIPGVTSSPHRNAQPAECSPGNTPALRQRNHPASVFWPTLVIPAGLRQLSMMPHPSQINRPGRSWVFRGVGFAAPNDITRRRRWPNKDRPTDLCVGRAPSIRPSDGCCGFSRSPGFSSAARGNLLSGPSLRQMPAVFGHFAGSRPGPS
jgi:hypothetical protein